MPSIELPTLNDVRALPADGVGRDRQLHRLVDARAAAEALTALAPAASSTRHGALATALSASEAVLRNGDDVSRDRLRDAITAPAFLALVPELILELREAASHRPDTGACTTASALDLCVWTVKHFRGQVAALDEISAAIAPLLAARCFAVDVTEPGLRADLCHAYAARVAAAAAAACTELVFGYRKHLVWDTDGCATCFAGDDVDDLEAVMPGIASGARMSASVVEADGSHAIKAGPCARFDGVEAFARLRSKLDGCLTGARIAKDRAASAIADAMTTMKEGTA